MNTPTLTPFERCLRDARIMRWLASCEPCYRKQLVEARAIVLECPIAEIDPDFTLPGEIEWLACAFKGTLALFEEDES